MLSLAFSPCPNDCFIFDALVHRRIDMGDLAFDVHLDDVEALNASAFAGDVDVTKLSFHAYAHCADRYVLLDAGSALGNGCGPLLISKKPLTPDDMADSGVSIAIPGRFTTANLLLGLAFPQARKTMPMLFSDIEDAVLDGRVDAGVIIHENRFTYEAKGLRKVVDLGELWESEMRVPIPLGGIVIKRSLPDDLKHRVGRAIRRSVEFAFANRAASLPYVRAHAQSMSDEVMYKHIDVYVNQYSVDLGPVGRGAVATLFDRAAASGVIPAVPPTLFLSR